jgi:hypothetical protein
VSGRRLIFNPHFFPQRSKESNHETMHLSKHVDPHNSGDCFFHCNSGTGLEQQPIQLAKQPKQLGEQLEQLEEQSKQLGKQPQPVGQ